MKMTRREAGKLLGAAALAPQTAASEWLLEAGSLRQRLVSRDGGLFCSSLRNTGSGTEWIHPAVASDEFLVETGEPARPVTGKGPLERVEHSQSAQGNWKVLEIRLRPRDAQITITRRYMTHRALPIVRQQTTVRNDGRDEVTVRRCDAFRLRVAPVPDALELHWMNNFGRAMMPNPGNPIHRRTVGDNVEHAIRTGPYSPDCGWFALTVPGRREGLVGGWEWSSPMQVLFGDRRDPLLIHGGLEAEGMAEPLPPGATFRGPAGWYGFFAGGLDEAARLSHMLVEELAPAVPREQYPWVGYCTWSASLDENSPFNAGSHPWFPTEENLVSQVSASADLGCELYLWDYGWFPRVGDWWCDKRRFPHGPGRVLAEVKRRGMKTGLWIGFGNADDDSEVVRKHPDWLATYGGRPIPDKFFTRTAASTWKTRTLCLAHRPAREWVKETLVRVIEEFQLDWLKHDFDLITICQDRNHTHNAGDSRYASCEAFYEIMDFVRTRYPNLLCENWLNNSAVPDYGVIQRHHVQLIGDAYQPFMLRQMVHGHVQMYPPGRQHRYVRFEDGSGDFRNMVRSGSLGGPWTLLTDPRRMTAEQRGILKGEIAFYKKHRHLLRGADVYRLLGRPHPRGWDAIWFVQPQRGEGLLYVFRGDHPAASQTVPLAGLEQNSRYRVTAADGGDAELQGRDLRVAIPRPGLSAVYFIHRG